MKKRNMLTKVAALSMAALMTVTGLPVAGLDGALAKVEAADAQSNLYINGTTGKSVKLYAGDKYNVELKTGSNTTATGSFALENGFFNVTSGSGLIDSIPTTPGSATAYTMAGVKSTASVVPVSAGTTKVYALVGEDENADDYSAGAAMDVVVSKVDLSKALSGTVKMTISDGTAAGTNEYSYNASDLRSNNKIININRTNDNLTLGLDQVTIGTGEYDVLTAGDVELKMYNPATGTYGAPAAFGALGDYKFAIVAKANAASVTGQVQFTVRVGAQSLNTSNTTVKALEPLQYNVNGAEYNVAALNDLLTYEPTNGSAITIDGADCDITYSNNTKVGTATMTIVPKVSTGFTGRFTKTFSIEPTDFTNVKVVGTKNKTLPSMAATGSQLKPSNFELYFDTALTDYEDSRYASAYEPDADDKMATSGDKADYAKRYVKLSSSDYQIVSYGDNKEVGSNGGSVVIRGRSGGMISSAEEATLTFDIVAKKNDLSKYGDASMKLGDVTIANGGKTTFTGSKITPTITVTYTDAETNAESTVASGNYDVEFAKNTDVGTATVTITGKNEYAGVITKNFNIEQKSIDDSDVNMSEPSSVTYDGTAKKPDMPAITFASKTLEQGKDFTLTYDNNTNAGTKAAVTVAGKGNYKGKKVVNFTINPASLNSDMFDKEIENQVYTGSEITPDVEGTFTQGDGEKYTLVKDLDYTLTYEQNIGNSDTTTYTPATIVVTGKNNFEGTVSKSFNIVNPDNDLSKAEIELVKDEIPYDGEYHSAVIKSVKIGENVLANNEYELVSAVSEKEAGTYTVQIKGTTDGVNYYGGIGETTFTIIPKEASVDFKLSATKKTYNGKAQSVTVKNVTRDGVEITEDDYTVSGTTKATKAGKKTVTVTLKGNYTGSAKKTWTIAKAKQTIKVSPASKTFKVKKVAKKAQTFKIKVTGAKGKVSYKSSSKKVTVKNGKVTVKKGTKKGTYKITVKAAANANYSASAQKTVKVVVK